MQNRGGRDQLPTDYQAVHAMKHARKVDNCNNLVGNWQDKDKYNQKMVIGTSSLTAVSYLATIICCFLTANVFELKCPLCLL